MVIIGDILNMNLNISLVLPSVECTCQTWGATQIMTNIRLPITFHGFLFVQSIIEDFGACQWLRIVEVLVVGQLLGTSSVKRRVGNIFQRGKG